MNAVTPSLGERHQAPLHDAPIGHGTAMWELAYRLLKHRIIHNELPAGAEIDDTSIAEELKISRTPVREAIVRLQNEKLVEIQPRRSCRVLPLPVDSMKQIYEFLTAIEAFAVWTLASRGPSPPELVVLHDCVRAMEEGLAQDDLGAWIMADESFHRALLSLSGNAYVEEVGFAFRDRVHRAHVIALKLRAKPVRSVQAHRELVDLIASGDADAARANHLAQRTSAGEELIALISKAGLKAL
jgi:DNA-binding GntR family transcriptional regulator